MQITNLMTIDVEDYFQVENFKGSIRRGDWEKYELRVGKNTERVLAILKSCGAKATFFVLGWVAERFQSLVQLIDKEGHEVACHGFGHELVYRQTKQQFRDDLKKARDLLEDMTNKKVIGYRAPSYSINQDSWWAIDILKEEGFVYDSSIYPLKRLRGGIVGAPRFLHKLANGLWELPISTNKFLGKNISFAGGGYFRLFPYSMIKWGIDAVNREGHPANIYLHPWEFDPDQPRVHTSWQNRFKHYVNLTETEDKFRRLLKDHRFTTIREYLNDAIKQ